MKNFLIALCLITAINNAHSITVEELTATGFIKKTNTEKALSKIQIDKILELASDLEFSDIFDKSLALYLQTSSINGEFSDTKRQGDIYSFFEDIVRICPDEVIRDGKDQDSLEEGNFRSGKFKLGIHPTRNIEEFSPFKESYFTNIEGLNGITLSVNYTQKPKICIVGNNRSLGVSFVNFAHELIHYINFPFQKKILERFLIKEFNYEKFKEKDLYAPDGEYEALLINKKVIIAINEFFKIDFANLNENKESFLIEGINKLELSEDGNNFKDKKKFEDFIFAIGDSSYLDQINNKLYIDIDYHNDLVDLIFSNINTWMLISKKNIFTSQKEFKINNLQVKITKNLISGTEIEQKSTLREIESVTKKIVELEKFNFFNINTKQIKAQKKILLDLKKYLLEVEKSIAEKNIKIAELVELNSILDIEITKQREFLENSLKTNQWLTENYKLIDIVQ
jgi:hypothetical protein